MITRYSSTIGQIVAELRGQTKVGRVKEIIIDPEKFSIAALAVEQPTFFITKVRFALSFDIVYLLKDGVIINEEDALIEKEGSVLLKKLINHKSFGIGQKVITSNGLLIGKVYDFLINTETLAITKFYVKKLFDESIIPSNKIIGFRNGTIVIKDNYTKETIDPIPISETMMA